MTKNIFVLAVFFLLVLSSLTLAQTTCDCDDVQIEFELLPIAPGCTGTCIDHLGSPHNLNLCYKVTITNSTNCVIADIAVDVCGRYHVVCDGTYTVDGLGNSVNQTWTMIDYAASSLPCKVNTIHFQPSSSQIFLAGDGSKFEFTFCLETTADPVRIGVQTDPGECNSCMTDEAYEILYLP
jgi:hypothetical protein